MLIAPTTYQVRVCDSVVCVLYNVCVVTIAIKVSVVKLLLLYIKLIIKVMVYRQIL